MARLIKSKRILTTVTCAVGFLLGGLMGLGVSTFFKGELAVVSCYIIGALIGTGIGGWWSRLERLTN